MTNSLIYVNEAQLTNKPVAPADTMAQVAVGQPVAPNSGTADVLTGQAVAPSNGTLPAGQTVAPADVLTNKPVYGNAGGLTNGPVVPAAPAANVPTVGLPVQDVVSTNAVTVNKPAVSAAAIADIITGSSQGIAASASGAAPASAPKKTSVAAPVKQPVFDFPKQNQPLVGVIDTGFAANNPDIDYSRITLGQDRVDGDANPLVSAGESNKPVSPALEIIGATQNNGKGIDGINDDAPLFAARASGSSEQWAQSLIEFVDAAKADAQPNAIVNINLNLTEVKKDGTILPRELKPAERAAIAYAQKHNVLVVVPAGDNPGKMSALGQLSKEFDNVIAVGAAKRVNNAVALSKAYAPADYSGSGEALDILADGTSGNTSGTSVAAAKVAGAASLVWAANPKLSYRQVIDILQRTATDLKTPNWDEETGAGLLNITAAVYLAKVTPAVDVDVPVRWVDFEDKNQPLIGIIDTGFNGKNPDIDYSRIILGRDLVDGDNNPLLETGEGNEHGTHVLGIIGATQSNGIGIDGMNDDAPIWLGRAVGSGKWAESLREFVDAAKASGQPNAVVNLSFDLTQINPDGSVTTRYELTPQEREALEYARQNGVMVVVAAGNDGGTMSALGQASQEFDNIITVGSIDYNGNRAEYSSFGDGLDIVARGGTSDQPIVSTVGEGADLDGFSSNDEISEDEMSAIANATFEGIFGSSLDTGASEPDAVPPEELSSEDRQVLEQAIAELQQLLSDGLDPDKGLISLELLDGYFSAALDAVSQFLDAFGEDFTDLIVNALEALEKTVDDSDVSTLTDDYFSMSFDFGVGEMAGTSVAAAKVTGAVSQVWAANPGLSYIQVKEILKKTAVDLNAPGWDEETGAGLVNIAAAVELAKRTQPQTYQPQPLLSPLTWSGEGAVTPSERPVEVTQYNGKFYQWVPYTVRSGDNLSAIASRTLGNGAGWSLIFERNRNVISNPNLIYPGQQILVPTEDFGYLQQQEEERRRQEEARRKQEQQQEEERRRQEEARRKQEQIQAIINQVTRKVGALGNPLRSYLSNGVTVYHFGKGILYVQPDGRYSFYQTLKKGTQQYRTLYGRVQNVYNAMYNASSNLYRLSKTDRMLVSTKGTAKVVYEFGRFLNNKPGFANKANWAGRFSNFANKQLVQTKVWLQFKARRAVLETRKFLLGNKFGRGLASGAKFVTKFVRNVTKKFPWVPKAARVAGKAIRFLGPLAHGLNLALTVGDVFTAKTEQEKRRAVLKAGASVVAGAVGMLGGPGMALTAASITSTVFDFGYWAADKLGYKDKLDKTIETGFNKVTEAAKSVGNFFSGVGNKMKSLFGW
ncbi:S8 family serine peptidase [Kamptonema formosum]|uniref:S8 family serine peptidase n=1 Tax=Kamptonema formosum TaxID=331992 RepID=UPI0012DE6C17|nr:S8 family serine peptidase [Oscillatoria sp. PCC 10802]